MRKEWYSCQCFFFFFLREKSIHFLYFVFSSGQGQRKEVFFDFLTLISWVEPRCTQHLYDSFSSLSKIPGSHLSSSSLLFLKGTNLGNEGSLFFGFQERAICRIPTSSARASGAFVLSLCLWSKILHIFQSPTFWHFQRMHPQKSLRDG